MTILEETNPVGNVGGRRSSVKKCQIKHAGAIHCREVFGTKGAGESSFYRIVLSQYVKWKSIWKVSYCIYSLYGRMTKPLQKFLVFCK